MRLLLVSIVLLASQVMANSKSPIARERLIKFSEVDLRATPMGEFQKDKAGQKCLLGTHEVGGKCVFNSQHCFKFQGNSCLECKNWYFMTKNEIQGNYCYNRWWMYVIYGFAAFAGLLMIICVCGYCCCGRKKRGKNNSETTSLVQNIGEGLCKMC